MRNFVCGKARILALVSLIPGFRPVLGTFWAALRAVLYSCALYVYVTCIHSRGTPLLSLVRCAYTIYTMSESTCTWQYACMHVFSASHVYAHPKHTCPTMGGGQRRRAPCMQAAFSQASISIITGYRLAVRRVAVSARGNITMSCSCACSYATWSCGTLGVRACASAVHWLLGPRVR